MTVISPTASPFDAIKQTSEGGAEFWSARDLMSLMKYDTWRNFESAVDRARVAAENQGHVAENHIAGASKMVQVGSGVTRAVRDYHLTRFGAYLTVMNGDPRKPEIAAAQTYFAVKTREAEVAPKPQLSGAELLAHAVIEAQAMIEQKDAQIAQLEPKASRYDVFLGADGDLSLRDAAQILARDHGVKIGQNRLAGWMRNNKWIDKRGIPYQARIDAGHLKAKPRTYKHPRTGEDRIADPQVRVTPAGLDLLAARLGAGQTVLEVSA